MKSRPGSFAFRFRSGVSGVEILLLLCVLAGAAAFLYTLRFSAQRAIQRVSWAQQTKSQTSFCEKFLSRAFQRASLPETGKKNETERGILVFSKKLIADPDLGERPLLRIPQGIVSDDNASSPHMIKWIELYLVGEEAKGTGMSRLAPSTPLGTLYARERMVALASEKTEKASSNPLPGHMKILVENVSQIEASLPAIGTETLFLNVTVGYPLQKSLTETCVFRFTQLGSLPIIFK